MRLTAEQEELLVVRYDKTIRKLVAFYLNRFPDNDKNQRREDLTQVAWLAFIKHIRSDKVQTEDDIEPLYYTITGAMWQYTIHSGLVKYPARISKEELSEASKTVRLAVSEDESFIEPSVPSHEDNIVCLHAYRQMLSRMDKQDRELIHRLSCGETVRDIASSMHISKSTAARRIQKLKPHIVREMTA